jgi:RNA polymerase sigma-70 factor, ECF subfamily
LQKEVRTMATVVDQYPGQRDDRAKLESQFAPLVEHQIPSLRRYAVALTHDRDRADDLVQDCLVRALAKQHLWQPETDLRAWLFTILYHSRVSDLRRSAREIGGNKIAAESLEPTPQWPDGRLQLLELNRGIGALPEPRRRALRLVCLEGVGYEQAAATLGVPVGTVRSRIARARKALRVEFDVSPKRRPRAMAKRGFAT